MELHRSTTKCAGGNGPLEPPAVTLSVPHVFPPPPPQCACIFLCSGDEGFDINVESLKCNYEQLQHARSTHEGEIAEKPAKAAKPSAQKPASVGKGKGKGAKGHVKQNWGQARQTWKNEHHHRW